MLDQKLDRTEQLTIDGVSTALLDSLKRSGKEKVLRRLARVANEKGKRLTQFFIRKLNRNSSSAVPSALAEELRASISGEVRFDEGSRALYSTDASNYRQIPIGVVLPRTAFDIIKTVEICRKYRVPITSRGGGTSLAGQCCNVAVIIDMSKYYNKILEINYEEKFARVQPGVVLDALRDRAEERHLTFGPDPATHNHCTIGGMLGNNSCGVHALMAGTTSENVLELDLLLYDGTRMKVGPTTPEKFKEIISQNDRTAEIYQQVHTLIQENSEAIRRKFPDIPRRVSGYNFPSLLEENGFDMAKAIVGSEGTLAIILEAKLRLVASPPVRSLVVLGYKDIFEAGDHVPQILESKPIGLEGMDRMLYEYMVKKHLHVEDLDLLPEGNGWLLCEFGGENKEESDNKAKALMERLKQNENSPSMKLYDDAEKESMIWEVRESGLGATARIPSHKDNWPGWEDSAVHPNKVGNYLRKLRKLFQKYDYDASLYGHFGQGCVHTRVPFDLSTATGVDNWRAFMHEAAELVISLGGSLSGEHGDGQARAELLPIMFGDQIVNAFKKFKFIFDPENMMNPGKIVRPYKIDENLRIGPTFNPKDVDSYFRFPDDSYSFARTTTRCVGVGKCRRDEGGTMCPSYMVTREEKHSTRGRARLLFEMLQGNPIKDGWRSEAVKESLDLCLACKGCKSDCPVNVDMATYKAEFLAHYYKNRLRPRSAYAFGLIGVWVRLMELVPNFVNLSTQLPLIKSITKKIGGVDSRKSIPMVASTSFRSWFNSRPKKKSETALPMVLLFPDTFNNNFHPETAKSAVAILEKAGFEVRIPNQRLCCGRPLYDYGMLELARRWLENIMQELQPYIETSTPILVLEPSCAAVFRDELKNLFPGSSDAIRLSQQVYLLEEFLQKYAGDFEYPKIEGKAIVQEHCHQKSVLSKDAESKILKKLGIDFEIPEPGCCGMAGAFGFEKHDISMAVGQQRLFTALGEADDENALVIANGFSCREQIRQNSSAHPLHIADVIALAQNANNPEQSISSASCSMHHNGDGRMESKEPTESALSPCAEDLAKIGRKRAEYKVRLTKTEAFLIGSAAASLLTIILKRKSRKSQMQNQRSDSAS